MYVSIFSVRFWKGDIQVGGGKRVNLSFSLFPCFTVFWGYPIPKCWETQHEKSHSHTPFCVCLSSAAKLSEFCEKLGEFALAGK